MTIKIHQYQGTNRIYSFQSKDEKTLTMKVYDFSKTRLFKASVELAASQIQELFSIPRAQVFLAHFPTYNIDREGLRSISVEDYVVPSALEGVVQSFMHSLADANQRQNQDESLSDNRIVIGGFSLVGLNIVNPTDATQSFGIGAPRQFQ